MEVMARRLRGGAFRERSSPRRRRAATASTSSAARRARQGSERGRPASGLPQAYGQRQLGRREPAAGSPASAHASTRMRSQAGAFPGAWPGSLTSSSTRRTVDEALLGTAVEHVDVAGEASPVTAAARTACPQRARPAVWRGRRPRRRRSSASSAAKTIAVARLGWCATSSASASARSRVRTAASRVAEETERVSPGGSGRRPRVLAVAEQVGRRGARGGSARRRPRGAAAPPAARPARSRRLRGRTSPSTASTSSPSRSPRARSCSPARRAAAKSPRVSAASASERRSGGVRLDAERPASSSARRWTLDQPARGIALDAWPAARGARDDDRASSRSRIGGSGSSSARSSRRSGLGVRVELAPPPPRAGTRRPPRRPRPRGRSARRAGR